MFILNQKRLEPGDIVLTKSKKGVFSNLIRWVTHGSFSHVAIFVGGANIIDATRAGVCDNVLMRHPFKRKQDFCVLRCLDMTSDQKGMIEGLLRNRFITAGYNQRGILQFLCSFVPSSRYKKVYCSQLAAESYAEIGIDIVSRSRKGVTPKDFEISPMFKQVDDCFVEIDNKSYWDHIKSEKPCGKKQQAVMRKLTKAMQKIYNNNGIVVSTIEECFDLDLYLLDGRIDYKKAEVISKKIVHLIGKTGFDSCLEDCSMKYYLAYRSPHLIVEKLTGMDADVNVKLDTMLDNYQQAMGRHHENATSSFNKYGKYRLPHFLCLHALYHKVIIYNTWAIQNIKDAKILYNQNRGASMSI